MLTRNKIDLSVFKREQLEEFVGLMAEDLELVMLNHKGKVLLSERDVDDIQSLLLDLKGE